MNLKLSGVGAEPKKVAILAGLLLVAGYFFISNRSSSTSASVTTPQAPGATPSTTSPRVPARQVVHTNRGGQSKLRSADDLKPSLKPKRDEEVDRSRIDPTLHLELLAKLKDVKVEGSSRSLFEAGLAPAAVPKQPEPEKIIVRNNLPTGPNPPPPPPPPKVDPPPPPIPLKFYGFVNQTKAGVKRAFFLDGDDIIVAAEGQTIKSRYKIVRIGINSAVVEDTQFKNNQQTLPLVEEVPG